MGPPAARDGAGELPRARRRPRRASAAIAALAGSDTLATARALAAALRRETPDLVLLGRASIDAETGQVGPEVAELLDLPQATRVRRLSRRSRRAHASTPNARSTTASRPCTGPLPAVITAAEDLAEERFPTKAEREAAADEADR